MVKGRNHGIGRADRLSRDRDLHDFVYFVNSVEMFFRGGANP